jgi:hypothetical protein
MFPSLERKAGGVWGSRQDCPVSSDSQLLDLQASDNAGLADSKLPDGLDRFIESSVADSDLSLDDACVLIQASRCVDVRPSVTKVIGGLATISVPELDFSGLEEYLETGEGISVI